MKSCPTCQGSFPTHFAVCPQDGTQLVEAGAWAVGSVVRGKYRVLAKIGQGGMGAVYKASHLAFEEVRALKVMAPELMSDDLFVKRFKQEAVITRKLQHPNAVRVDDIDEAEDGRPFIVMEFIEGRSLKNLIRDEGPLPVPRVCAIIKQVASALDAAHRINLIHRDIKPENIVLIETPQGEQAKVLDFGIAKLKEARRGAKASMTLTETGMVIGTPQYMSPEQAMGMRGDQLDGRSDLYSLGVVMYQMLTADLPFKADTTMEMILAHLQKPPAPINLTHPELNLPAPLVALTMRLLEKNPDQRPPNALVLIQEIEAAEQGAAHSFSLPPTKRLTVEDMQPAAPPPPSAPAAPRGAPPVPSVQSPPPLQPVQRAIGGVAMPVAVKSPQSSRVGLWIAVACVVVVLGAGAWYFLSRHPVPRTGTSGGSGVTPGSPQTDRKPLSGQSASDSGASVAAQKPDGAPSEQVNSPGESETPPARVETPRAKPPERGAQGAPRQAFDAKDVRGHITLGNFYFNQGEYDKAIEEFQAGLRVAPRNAELNDLIQKARRAKKAEEDSLLQ